MPGKRIALLGALVALGGIAIFLLGAFVLTTDGRHHDVSGAVYAGLLMVVVGGLLLASSAIGALARRLRGRT
jgi:hypothetical protein